MSDIMSLIEGINTSKGNIKTAIEGKGVTVSEDKKLADYSGLISSISTGSAGSAITCIVQNGSQDSVPSDFFDTYFLYLTYYNSSGTVTIYDVTSLAEPITLSVLGDVNGGLILFESDCPYLFVGGSNEAESSYPLVFDDVRQSYITYMSVSSGDSVLLHYIAAS